MPSIEKEITTWLNGRPEWQKVLAAKVLAEGRADEGFIEELAAKLIDKQNLDLPGDFKQEDLPTSASTGSRVELVSVGGLVNVNALAEDQTLKFAPNGLTVIYGDNGSGKSGYARLIKEIVRARHHQRVLPNAFGLTSSVDQSATIVYRVDGEEKSLGWPEIEDAELAQIHFYDEACGDDYLVSNTELSYRPSALVIFDRLIIATDMLRDAVDRRLAVINTPSYSISGLRPDTTAGVFVKSVNHNTTDDQIDAVARLTKGAEQQLAALVQSEARLLSTDQSKEKNRLVKGAASLKNLASHLVRIDELLSPPAATKLEKMLEISKTLRNAADIASKTGFAGEPLSGIGSETWRALWDAAEEYSQAEAYHNHTFPFIDEGAHCPLCQQELGIDARARLVRFRTFVHDQTAKKAKEAELAYRAAITTLAQFEISTVETTRALTFLETEDSDLAEKLRAVIDRADQAKKRIGERLRGETKEEPVKLIAVNMEHLRSLEAAIDKRATKINAEAFAKQLRTAIANKNELADQIELAKHVKELKADVARQRKVKSVMALRGTLSTQPITRQSSSLARAYVTNVIDSQFSDESENLGLEHVMLGDMGGEKGKLHHKPTLLDTTLKDTHVQDVLSEGEQTALGLAGLFTELKFDDSNSTLVLDDPITSLDHGRRGKVARRIAKLADGRQVIVFTHDLTFLGELIRAADDEGVSLSERSIVKDNRKVPGLVLDKHPWKASDARKRIGDLRAGLAKIKKEQIDLDPEAYESEVRLWAGLLSETWERIVRNDIVGKVVDRGTTEVRPKMIRLLAKITDKDNVDFQAGYSEVSKWAPRHDKSEEVNFVAPTVEEMEAELKRIDAWYKRIADYAK